MEIITPSYLHTLLQSPNTSNEDVLTVKVSELKQFAHECEYNGRFIRHPYYCSVEEACQHFHIAKVTLYNWLKSGKVHGEKKGRKWMIAEADLM